MILDSLTLGSCSLIEEVLYSEPWKLLLACMLLNKTNAKQVGKRAPYFPCPHPACPLDVAEESLNTAAVAVTSVVLLLYISCTSQVRPVLGPLLQRWPTPELMRDADVGQVEVGGSRSGKGSEVSSGKYCMYWKV